MHQQIREMNKMEKIIRECWRSINWTVFIVVVLIITSYNIRCIFDDVKILKEKIEKLDLQVEMILNPPPPLPPPVPPPLPEKQLEPN